MSNVCQIFGAKASFGKSVSHSHRRTNRRWNPNIQHKRYLRSERLEIKKYDAVVRRDVAFEEDG